MRTPRKCRASRLAFTLAELVTTTGVLLIAVGVVFALASAGTKLFAANVATNNAHRTARLTSSRLVQDLYQAVSVPFLLDASLQATTPVVSGGSVVPQPGVSFYTALDHPCRLNGSVAPGSNTYPVNFTGSNALPKAGDRMVLPTKNVDTVVVSVSGNGADRNVQVADPASAAMSGDIGSSQAAVYFLRRVGYACVGGDLRFYPNLGVNNSTFVQVASGISDDAAFSHPVGANGQADTSRIIVRLATRDRDNSFSRVTSSATQMLLKTNISGKYSLTTAR